MVEAQPHKGALEVADEMRGLLDGSRQVNVKKTGAGSLPAINNTVQVGGLAVGGPASHLP